jgi:hypothetical protein
LTVLSVREVITALGAITRSSAALSTTVLLLDNVPLLIRSLAIRLMVPSSKQVPPDQKPLLVGEVVKTPWLVHWIAQVAAKVKMNLN